VRKLAILLAAVVISTGVVAEGEDSVVKFMSVPAGTTITYINDDDKTVTEFVVEGKEYPSAGVVEFGEAGTVELLIVGSGVPATVRGDVGAKFNLGGSTAVGGPLVSVPDDSSGVIVTVGDGPTTTVAIGRSTGLAPPVDAVTQNESERQVGAADPIPLAPPEELLVPEDAPLETVDDYSAPPSDSIL